MSNVNIQNLPPAISLSGSEYTIVDQGGVTKRAQTSLFGGLAALPVIASNTMLANTTAGAAQPIATTQSQMLDTITTTQGAILFRGPSAWVNLNPGTSGYFLQSQGSGANPLWAAPTIGAGGSDTQVQYNSGGFLAGSSAMTYAVSGSLARLTVGVQQTTQGRLILTNTAAGAFPITLQSSNGTSAAWTLTLPTTAGTNGYALTTDGSGVTSWSAITTSAAGSNTQVQFNNGGAFGASANLTFSGSTLTMGVAGSVVGGVSFGNATSGTITLNPVTGALGSAVLSLPAATDTLVGRATTDTLTNKTWNGVVIGLAYGGTNANLTASNGGIFYSTASAGAILSGTATANQLLLSGASGAPAWSTVTHPATTTINQLLYSSSNNVLAGLATANGGILNANSSGVPSLTVTPTLGVQQTTQGQLILANTAAGAFPTTIQSSNSASAAWTFTLPTTAGTNGYALTTNGSGVTSWTALTAAPGGSDTQVQFNSSGSFAGSANLTWVSPTLTIGTSGVVGVLQIAGTTSGTAKLSASATGGAWQLGAADASTAVAQTLQVQSVVAGTSNTAGALLTIKGSAGTGTGVGGAVKIQVATAGSSGTSQNSFSDIITFSQDAQTITFGSGAAILIWGGSTLQVTRSSGQNLAIGNTGGNVGAAIGLDGACLANATQFGFSSVSSVSSVNPDTILTRRGAANFQIGAADAASPVSQTLSVQSVVAGTSNTAGANWTLSASRGTGTGSGGQFIFKTAPANATGTSQNALATALTITAPSQAGGVTQQPSVVVGNAAINTSDVEGFLYIASCAGTPTGTPTTFAGRVPMVYDTTNHQFWIYDGGWKQPKTPAAAALVTWQ